MSPKKKKSKVGRKILRQRREFFVGVGFTVVGVAVAFEHVYFACLFWVIALYFGLQWLGHFELLSSNPRLRNTLSVGITAVVIAASWKPVIEKRHEQLAAKTTGYIAARQPLPLAYPILEFANSGNMISWTPSSTVTLFQDAGIRLDLGDDGIELSTTVRDRFGHEVVRVDRNHWTVVSAYSVDHNYTDDALEVLDGGGHPVLQVQLLSDRIRLAGEWHDEFGHASQITECSVGGGSKGCVQVFGFALPEETQKKSRPPMFLYPSREHWAEWSSRGSGI